MQLAVPDTVEPLGSCDAEKFLPQSENLLFLCLLHFPPFTMCCSQDLVLVVFQPPMLVGEPVLEGSPLMPNGLVDLHVRRGRVDRLHERPAQDIAVVGRCTPRTQTMLPNW